MAELLSGVVRKFNTIEFVLLEGGDERFKRGKSGIIQDFWVKGGDCWHPVTKFSVWTKSRQRTKSITLDICYVEGEPSADCKGGEAGGKTVQGGVIPQGMALSPGEVGAQLN